MFKNVNATLPIVTKDQYTFGTTRTYSGKVELTPRGYAIGTVSILLGTTDGTIDNTASFHLENAMRPFPEQTKTRKVRITVVVEIDE